MKQWIFSIGVLWTSTLMEFSLTTGLMMSFSFWILYGGYRTLYLCYHTLARDLKGAQFMIKLLILIKRCQWQNMSVPKMFSKTVERQSSKKMFIFENDFSWTFQKMEDYSNQIAHYFKNQNFKKGDVISLFMENRPEYVGIWLGLAKIGVVPSLINNNLMATSLSYCISVVKSKGIIYGIELTSKMKSISKELNYLPIYVTGSPDCNSIYLDSELKNCSKAPLSKNIQDSIGFNDPLLYIYTSGTTGLPKAAIIKHSRYIISSNGCCDIVGVRSDDIVYCPLPLYHSVAGMLSLSGTMMYGMTMVIKKKFSASSFWKDCVQNNVTVIQYIGEMCRYLLNTPFVPEEKEHRIRLMFGNGLRSHIWEPFLSRFSIPKISEFYGSTEGNSSIINNENRVGSVGFISVLFPSLMPMGLIKIDSLSGKELRNQKGLCIPCEPGEPGEFVGKIKARDPVREFSGYVQEDSNKKILSNVFSNGDQYFRSGDLLLSDQFGWLYFQDRLGDSFRWKGENVSTTEIESIMSEYLFGSDVAVYGVLVPGTEGKAGMAAISAHKTDIDLKDLVNNLLRRIPIYALPLFLRISTSLEVTGTFKHKKFNYIKEGFNPHVILKDPLYFFHPSTQSYEPLNFELYDVIIQGKLRL